MLYTGARCGEALWLDWRNVDLQRRQVMFENTKNGDSRGVPLNQRVVAELANLPHREGEVFRRPDGFAYERPDDDDLATPRPGAASRRLLPAPVHERGLRILRRTAVATPGQRGITERITISAS
jgi:integrase